METATRDADVVASPDVPLSWVQSDDMAAYTGSNVRGAQSNRLSPSEDQPPTPAKSPEAGVQDCQQDVAVAVPGKEEREGENGDETEGAEDQQQEGEAAEDERVYASEDDDEGNEQVASSDSDAAEPEDNVVDEELRVAIAPQTASDSELPQDPPLTELEGNAPEVRVLNGAVANKKYSSDGEAKVASLVSASSAFLQASFPGYP